MAREVNLLRRTWFGAYPYCLAVLEAYAELVPLWQRSCLFLYAGFGTWLANRFGVDMAAMWSRGESVLEEACVVNHLEPAQLAELLRQFSAQKVREQGPLEFQEAKETVYDQMYWPLAAHVCFALQPSAFARQNFVMNVADSIEQEYAQVADLGCGPGVILSNLLLRRPCWSARGLDISHVATDYATRLADHKGVGERVRFSTGDLVNLPYRDASFDLVVVSEVLEHVPAIRAALAEIKRVLRSGGKAAITVPIESRTALHVHSLKDGDDLATLCLEAGFTIRHLETHLLPGFGDDWKHVFLMAESEADARHEYANDREAASALCATRCHVDTQAGAMEPRPEPEASLTLCQL